MAFNKKLTKSSDEVVLCSVQCAVPPGREVNLVVPWLETKGLALIFNSLYPILAHGIVVT